MKKLCRKCNQVKEYREFVSKNFSDTYCVECNKKDRFERNRKNARKNDTGWMDIFIGRQEKQLD